jgi:hypothetical protein
MPADQIAPSPNTIAPEGTRMRAMVFSVRGSIRLIEELSYDATHTDPNPAAIESANASGTVPRTFAVATSTTTTDVLVSQGGSQMSPKAASGSVHAD